MTSLFDPLDPGEVRVLTVSLKTLSAFRDFLRLTLSSDEQSRAARFRKEEDRIRFELCRGFLRYFLGTISGAAPESFEIQYGSSGKPFLADSRQQLFFNVAHSGDWAAFVATRTGEVGVDIESWRTAVDEEKIVERYFSDEDQTLWKQAAPESRTPLFFALWTRHEALLKASGVGVLTRDALPQGVIQDWWVRPLELVSGLSGAVAGGGDSWRGIVHYQNDNSVTKCLNNIVNTGRW